MLKTRLIPCLDIQNGRIVKGVNFVDLVDAGDPIAQAKFYDEQGADELTLLDITASHEDRSPMLDIVQKVAEQCFMPLTVGGGITSLEDIRALLLAGADKVAINTAAIKTPELISKAAEKFGSQCITVAIDAKAVDKEGCPLSQEDADQGKAHAYEIFTHGGRNGTDINALQWAKYMEDLGAGEILLTSMDRDGTKKGYNIPMTKAISEYINIPVIASGGVGNLQHLVDVIKQTEASAVLAASIFHFGEYTIAEAKEYMKNQGIHVRI